MKLLFCAKCFELVQLRNGVRSCYCGNVVGRYLDDDHTIEVAIKDMTRARLIGITNRFLGGGASHNPMDDGGYFAEQNSYITVIPWHSGDDDVVYADWDEMHTMLVEKWRRELFGELTDVGVAEEKILGAIDNGTDTDYMLADVVGCSVDHIAKIFCVFDADDVISARTNSGVI